MGLFSKSGGAQYLSGIRKGMDERDVIAKIGRDPNDNRECKPVFGQKVADRTIAWQMPDGVVVVYVTNGRVSDFKFMEGEHRFGP